MLWVLHPVNVESVAWVSELKNTQSGVFFFMSVLCFLRFQAHGKPRWYALAFLCGAAAMLSKPSTVVLPMVLLLCVWWQQQRWRLPDILQVLPFLLVSCFLSARTVVEQRGQIIHVATPEWNLGMAGRFAVAGRAIWFYAAKVLWPVRLSFMYPLWKIQPDLLLSWLALAGLITLGTLLWMWRGKAWARACLFGGGYFVVALLPVLGFFDVFYFRYSFVADHFQYLASLGLITLVVSAVATICERTGRLGHRVGAALSATALLMLGLLTWRQTCSFKNGETLWRHALASYPNSWGPHLFWGMMLRESGHLPEAVDELDRAVQLNPDAYDAHNNLGNALARAGRIEDAISQYVQTLRIKPDYAKAHINFGNALLLQGKAQEAISHYEQALQISPGLAEAHCGLGIALEQAGRVREAIGHYEQALRIRPDFAPAQNALARLQAGQ
jgi:tetratricopeptide (TPR) repeat protein